MSNINFVVAALLIVSSSEAYAGVYKCVVNGKTTYSDVPCASNASKLAINPNQNTAQGMSHKVQGINQPKSLGRLEDQCPQGALHAACVSDMRARQKNIDRLDREIEDTQRQKERDLAEIRSKGSR
jgi:hypothetical protein